MTPKEKAVELRDYFYDTMPNEAWFNPPLGLKYEYKPFELAKEFAIKFTNEMGSELKDTIYIKEYWKKVKYELEKL